MHAKMVIISVSRGSKHMRNGTVHEINFPRHIRNCDMNCSHANTSAIDCKTLISFRMSLEGYDFEAR